MKVRGFFMKVEIFVKKLYNDRHFNIWLNKISLKYEERACTI